MINKVLTKCKKSVINLNRQIPKYVTAFLQMHKSRTGKEKNREMREKVCKKTRDLTERRKL